MKVKNKKLQKGMTLLEVLVAISILVVLVYTVAQVLKANIDMRLALSQKADVSSKANRVISLLDRDLMHTFYISPKFERKRTNAGKERTVFKICRYKK